VSEIVLASLPMYDLPELRAAHDAVWASVGARLARSGVAGVPTSLTRGGAAEAHWSDPDLLLSQTCGYPLVHAFAGRLRVIATPSYDAPGCEGPTYSSLVVVRSVHPARDLVDLRGSVCAVNERASHSGMNALRAMIAPLARGAPFFGEVLVTGSHEASLARVQRGEADVCAVDAVLHALLLRHRPDALTGTRVLARSPSAPALPYVTRASTSDELVRALREALVGVLADPALASTRDALLLKEVTVLEDDAYDAIERVARAAAERGYPVLA
jgi:ABC-type phosphate/phosphonate transport system substrate-binding protein